jgi:methionyl-tRNA synthetase
MFSTSLPEFVMIAQKLGISVTSLVCFLVVVALWTIVWKGWALWTAARRHEKKWFVVLLVVNTLGVLEIIYLFFLNKRKK